MTTTTTTTISPISWAHSCCSAAQLSLALDIASPVTAIEVDVCWNRALNAPTMKHQKESTDETDFLTSAWLELLFKHSNKSKISIVKFDFKNVLTVRPTLEALKAQQETLLAAATANVPKWEFEVWLNGDVLRGPGSPPEVTPIDPVLFFEACETYQNCTLSLGWTTNFSVTQSFVYDNRHVDDMLALLDKYRKGRRVTFPIRASLCRDSWPALERLLRVSSATSSMTTLTLWSGPEGVPQDDLDWARQMMPSCYVDCDKGPRHAFHNPVRVFHYLWYLIRG